MTEPTTLPTIESIRQLDNSGNTEEAIQQAIVLNKELGHNDELAELLSQLYIKMNQRGKAFEVQYVHAATVKDQLKVLEVLYDHEDVSRALFNKAKKEFDKLLQARSDKLTKCRIYFGYARLYASVRNYSAAFDLIKNAVYKYPDLVEKSRVAVYFSLYQYHTEFEKYIKFVGKDDPEILKLGLSTI